MAFDKLFEESAAPVAASVNDKPSIAGTAEYQEDGSLILRIPAIPTSVLTPTTKGKPMARVTFDVADLTIQLVRESDGRTKTVPFALPYGGITLMIRS